MWATKRNDIKIACELLERSKFTKRRLDGKLMEKKTKQKEKRSYGQAMNVLLNEKKYH